MSEHYNYGDIGSVPISVTSEQMYPLEKEIAEHYGYTELANARGCWKIEEGVLDRLKTLPEVLDKKKKIKVTFDYDPDFPKALLQVWEGLKSPHTDS